MSGPTPREQKVIGDIELLLADGRVEEAEAACWGLLRAADSAAPAASSLLGRALLLQQRFEEALPHLESAARARGEPSDWLNLLIAAARARRLDLADEACQRSVALASAAAGAGEDQPSVGWVYNLYARALCDARAFTEALAPLEALRALYLAQRTTATESLLQRGLPDFDDLLDTLEAVFCGLGSAYDYRAWLEAFSRELDDGGRQGIAGLVSTIAGELEEEPPRIDR